MHLLRILLGWWRLGEDFGFSRGVGTSAEESAPMETNDGGTISPNG